MDKQDHGVFNNSKIGRSRSAVPCEIYSRVTGYFMPVSQFNPGKKEEFRQRKCLAFDKCVNL